MKKQKKIIKKMLKKDNVWSVYKKTFKHKKMRLILTSINEVFEGDISTYEIEKQLISFKSDIKFWENTLSSLSKNFKKYSKNIKWNELGKFLFYTYHQSEYYIKKSTLENIYNQENFIEINNTKKQCYDSWLKSLYLNGDSNFNVYVIKFLRLIK